MRIFAFALLIAAAYPTIAVSADPAISDSVVRVTVTRRAPNLLQPWTKASPADASGTGFVIDGQRLLTNAHVVEYASQIYIQPNKSAEKYEATVEVLSTDMDLAVLKVDEPGFFENRPAIPVLNELPKAKSPVNVYGFPVGGEQLSVTEGIISRIEFTRYGTGSTGLRVQIDAALNPGNSGGPAVSDGKLVGVAFQVLQQAENVGYLIPVEEVATFLEDAKDGTYSGKAQLMGELQTVENDALRAKLGLMRGLGGAMLTRAVGANDGALKVGDVITQIGDQVLDQTSKVKVSDELTLPFTYLVPKLAKDGKIKLKILRDGKSLDIEVPTTTHRPELIPPLRGTYPRYFIYGPLVFSAVSREFMGTVGRAGGLMMVRGSPIFTRLQDLPTFSGEELVVISSPMFSHRITKGYSQPFSACIKSVNGTAIQNLTHLVEVLRDAKGEFIEFDFVDRDTERLIFRRAEVLEATDDILSDNGIRKQFSDELEPIWHKK